MDTVRVEVEIEDRGETTVLEVEGGSVATVLKEVRALAALEDIHVFEQNKDEPIGAEIEKKKVFSVTAHRAKKIPVKGISSTGPRIANSRRRRRCSASCTDSARRASTLTTPTRRTPTSCRRAAPTRCRKTT